MIIIKTRNERILEACPSGGLISYKGVFYLTLKEGGTVNDQNVNIVNLLTGKLGYLPPKASVLFHNGELYLR